MVAVRHLGDALDQYYEETILFERILHKYDVDAYFSGHTHCASYANHNGLWLINSDTSMDRKVILLPINYILKYQ